MKIKFCIAFIFLITPLLSQSADTLEYDPEDDEYNLVIASLKGDLPYVQNLIEKGLSPNMVLENTVTPLIYASQGGNIAVCSYLLSKGADINFRPTYGPTPLIAAIKAQKSNMVDFLLNHQADINKGDEKARTPLMHSIINGDTALFKLLLNKGASLSQTDTLGMHSLMLAVLYNKPYFVEYLLQQKLDPNHTDKYGTSSLMLAALNQSFEILDLLIQYGANINYVSKKGQSVFTIALSKHDEKLLIYFIDKGAQVNIPLKTGRTTLSVANYFKCDAFMIEHLTTNKVKLSVLPDWGQIYTGASILWNANHIMGNINLGLKEFRYDTEISLGFFYRLTPVRVLANSTVTNEYYQYWENRHAFSVDLTKNFAIKYSPLLYRQGLFIKTQLLYSKNSFRGVGFSNNYKFYFSPGFGLFKEYKKVKLFLVYQYLNFNNPGVSVHNIKIGFNYLFGTGLYFNNKIYQL